ncbi:phosphopantetheine-binding protein [Mycobacterium sp.]|uniref:phosphopantetheine-binding protein n=1 Tax=Mycobacterium sp. TaxID=1785 RepID=UPI003D0CDF2C
MAGSPSDVRAEVAQLLGVGADAVDPAGNLISQGLDSIRMMTLAGKWRRRGIDVDFAALSAAPTVEAWSRLVGADASEPVVPTAPTVPAADGAFPLAPMQHAMWVGRHDSQPLGGVAGHLYVEFDGGPIDPERQAQAATSLALRHPMLRVRFPADGTQQIDEASAHMRFPVTVHDFRDLADDTVGERLLALREAKSHQQLDRQVFELTLSLWPGEKSRLHVDLDMQAADAMSYRTLMADLARYWPDGVLEFVGRADHRVKISGYRVEIGEVEVALRQIPGVATVVAAVVTATGGAEVLAAAIHADDPQLTADRVRASMTDLVPAHMIPQHVSFVDHVPYTSARKIDRRLVTGRLTAAVADSTAPERCAPSTPLESAIAAIVGDVPGVDSVGADDDFFSLGGDSVLATQVVARIRAWLDTPDAIVADIFATRTVSALAGLLGRRESDPGPLEQVAELYLEVTGMDAGHVVAAIAGNEAVQ